MYQNDQLFAKVEVNDLTGVHHIYSNRESKADLDIERILIENYADTEEFRMVLFPGYMN